MPVLSKSTALTMYSVGAIPDETILRAHAFTPIDQTADEKSVGAVNLDDYMDTAWAASPPQKGHFLTFGMRVDTRRIPGAVLKKHFDLALAEEKRIIAEAGKRFITKDRKREIKEQVTLRLRAKAEPVPAVFDVAVDLQKKLVFFFNSSKKPKELFEVLWMNMTGEAPIEITPLQLAEALDSNADLLTDASGFLTTVLDNGFEWQDNFFSVPAKATLSSVESQSTMALEVTPGAANLTELSAPLEGRKAVKVAMKIETDQGEFGMTVRATDFGVAGLKTPKVETKIEEGQDPDGPFLEKMYLIEIAMGRLHAAYQSTLKKSAVSAEDF